MTIQNNQIFARASVIIKSLYGEKAEFREGQYEAIEATMTKHRTLVVQRTGWGKSLVYFVCTKLMREHEKGVTMVVSPLLSLMQNQIEAASQMGLTCDMLNSQTKDRREEILQSMVQGTVDLVLVTPETLFSSDIQKKLKDIRIGLFVIDEAHCISDWGHDFRLEYSRLKDVIQELPTNVPVLATTATANDRVVNDLKTQLGNDVFISRGPLSRDSLWIQVLHIQSKAERYAWILENIERLPGSGIIYCLTQRDCDYLSDFLQKNGVPVMSYYSRDGEQEEKNRLAEEAFKQNKIKAIVATVKLGMGYDKGDIAFVIHFQMPANIVSYYQQIGRAGRNIDRAYTFLMSGKEDEDILNYFINTAFPTEDETIQIIDFISQRAGTKKGQLESALNIRGSRIDKALNFLIKDGYIYKDGSNYYVSPKPFAYDREHYQAITAIRRQEMEQMKSLVSTEDCYSKFTVQCLDDFSATVCGHCANCVGHDIFVSEITFEGKQAASEYINGLVLPIEPRKMWVFSSATLNKKIMYINQPGLCLSKYGDVGFGELVKQDKYSHQKRFRDELVGKSAELLRSIVREKGITHVTCVPSLRSRIVDDFSERLAGSLGLPFVELLEKHSACQQKQMENSAHQCSNAYTSFSAIDNIEVPEKVLLIDDIVDSKWTITVCGYRLMEQGCKEVYPFALADSSQKED